MCDKYRLHRRQMYLVPTWTYLQAATTKLMPISLLRLKSPATLSNGSSNSRSIHTQVYDPPAAAAERGDTQTARRASIIIARLAPCLQSTVRGWRIDALPCGSLLIAGESVMSTINTIYTIYYTPYTAVMSALYPHQPCQNHSTFSLKINIICGANPSDL